MTIADPDALRPIHPFPARMAPSIAMTELKANKGGRLKVLDPMVGSGTTIVLSKLMGHRAFGIDLDPLAVLQAQTWATTSLASELQNVAADVVDEARGMFPHVRLRDAYPPESSAETKKFIRYWFDATARRQLRAFNRAIEDAPPQHRVFLLTVLSRMIIAKNRGVSLAMDLAHSRPHKVYTQAPVMPLDEFSRSAERTIRDCPFVQSKRLPKSKFPDASVVCGDARKINMRGCQFDLILTSPPYLNAIDYMRCSKFALVWMGHDIENLRATRSLTIGSEVTLPANESAIITDTLRRIPARQKLVGRVRRILDRYVLDIGRVLSETSRLLVDGGHAVFVVGDSRIRGVFVSNSRIVELLAESSGLELVDRNRRELQANRRYMPPPKADSGKQMQARMGYEVILKFRRTAR